MKLSGKIALITGGTSGIGLATAKLFKEHGAKVIITARTAESFEKAKKDLGDQFDVMKADVCLSKDLTALYSHIKEKYTGLDILFANAGIAFFAPTPQVDEKFFDQQFNTNVRGLYFTITNAIPLMKKGSRVLLNASVVSQKGISGASVYAATKAAVRSFVRSWTAEFPCDDIRFNAISPGAIETPIYSKMGMNAEQVQGFSDHMKSIIPAHRFGAPEEIANVALFLCSSDSNYIVGADIAVDGGFGQI